jgi:hypothetical protein
MLKKALDIADIVREAIYHEFTCPLGWSFRAGGEAPAESLWILGLRASTRQFWPPWQRSIVQYQSE